MRDASSSASPWPADGPGGPVVAEIHFGRALRCFGDRPHDLDSMFRATVVRSRHRPALVHDGSTIDYAELEARVERLAHRLAALGVGRGDRVALLLGNRPEFLVVVLASARLGAVSVPIGTRLAPSEVAHVVDDCRAVCIVHDTATAGSVPPPGSALALRHRLSADDPSLDGGAGTAAPPLPPAPVSEEDVAVLLYTSGTTGRPKGAMLTHLGIVHSVVHFARCWTLSEADRTLLAVPASHVTGLVSLLLTTVFVGGCTVVMPAFKARDFLALAAAEAITYTLMVPAMYLLCLREPAFAAAGAADLGAWRVGGFGGSPMPPSAVAELAAKLPRLQLLAAYGATETTSPTTLMPAAEFADHLDSVGLVVPCGELRVVGTDGGDVGTGEAGEIWIRGPMVVPGYWQNPEADARSFVDGFWRSGDVGSVDADGHVRVHDRLKDMINRGGFKIWSAEVEHVLARHPDIVECAVVAVPDPVLGERVCAVVVTAGDALDAAAVRAHCAGHLADYKVPEFVELRHEPLPRNANGKVLKAQLRERA